MDGYSSRCGSRRPVQRGRRPRSAACVREGTQLLGCLCRQTTWRHDVSSFRDKSLPWTTHSFLLSHRRRRPCRAPPFRRSRSFSKPLERTGSSASDRATYCAPEHKLYLTEALHRAVLSVSGRNRRRGCFTAARAAPSLSITASCSVEVVVSP